MIPEFKVVIGCMVLIAVTVIAVLTFDKGNRR